jgi:hypothetical protein
MSEYLLIAALAMQVLCLRENTLFPKKNLHGRLAHQLWNEQLHYNRFSIQQHAAFRSISLSTNTTKSTKSLMSGS